MMQLGDLDPSYVKEQLEKPDGKRRKRLTDSLTASDFGFSWSDVGVGDKSGGKRKREDVEDAASTVGSSNKRRALSGANDEPGQCKVCEENVQIHAKYCVKHNSAYRCLKNKSFENTKCAGTGKFVETDESLAFKKIFWWSKRGDTFYAGDECKESQVLFEFCKSFPDGKETKGKARGNGLVLSKFVTAQGSRNERVRQSQDPLMDYEAFQIRMEQVRKWKHQRSLQEWDALKAQPESEVDRDNSGPRWSPLRLAIPGWLLAIDCNLNNVITYEDRSFVDETKARQMTEEERDSLVPETRRGFGEIAVAPRLCDMQIPLAPTDATSRATSSGVSGLAILMDAARSSADSTEPLASFRSTSVVPPTSAKTSSTPEKANEKQDVDVGSLRNNAHSLAKDMIAKTKESLNTNIRASQGVLKQGQQGDDEVYYKTLLERYETAVFWTGQQHKSDTVEGAGAVVNWDELELLDLALLTSEMEEKGTPEQQSALKSPKVTADVKHGYVHTQLFRQKLAQMELCPIENPVALASLKEVEVTVKNIKALTSANLIEKALESITEWKQLADQMAKIIATALVDLKRTNKH